MNSPNKNDISKGIDVIGEQSSNMGMMDCCILYVVDKMDQLPLRKCSSMDQFHNQLARGSISSGSGNGNNRL